MSPGRRQPNDRHEPRRHLARPAVAIHLVEERSVADTRPGSCCGAGRERCTRWIGQVAAGPGWSRCEVAPPCSCRVVHHPPACGCRRAKSARCHRSPPRHRDRREAGRPSMPTSSWPWQPSNSASDRGTARPHCRVSRHADRRSDRRHCGAAVSMPVSRWRVGCTRLVSSAQASPRRKSIHTPVPVKPVWPIVSSEQALPPDQPSCRASQPRHRVADCRLRISASHGSAPCSRRCAASRTPSIVPNSPAWPAAPPSAKAFSSCTSPRITRPRQVQRSVAAVFAGSAPQASPAASASIAQGTSGQVARWRCPAA